VQVVQDFDCEPSLTFTSHATFNSFVLYPRADCTSLSTPNHKSRCKRAHKTTKADARELIKSKKWSQTNTNSFNQTQTHKSVISIIYLINGSCAMAAILPPKDRRYNLHQIINYAKYFQVSCYRGRAYIKWNEFRMHYNYELIPLRSYVATTCTMVRSISTMVYFIEMYGGSTVIGRLFPDSECASSSHLKCHPCTMVHVVIITTHTRKSVYTIGNAKQTFCNEIVFVTLLQDDIDRNTRNAHRK